MDTLFENGLNQVLEFDECEQTNFKNNVHCFKILEDLQSLRKSEVLCDIRIEADDGKIVFAHKNVLMASSPYFCGMFSNFYESNKDVVNIRELDSTVLQLLVDYIYTGEIMVTKENVQVLLPAGNLLQLDFVNHACTAFLQKQLDASNCLGIRAFADLHNCTELLSRSEALIKKEFLEVIKSDEFLSLSSEEVVKLISCSDINAPSEEKIFDCVVKWVKHDLDLRKDFLPELMEHVRLPLLASRPGILFSIVNEPLLKNSQKCNDYVSEALRFNPQTSVQHFDISKMIRCQPRQFGGSQKVILMFNWSDTFPKCYTEWYDPVTQLRKNAPEISDFHEMAGLGVMKNKFVFALGGVNRSCSQSVRMLDVSSQSPCWIPIVNMLVCRKLPGVGVLDNCIYAVGGYDGISSLNSVEVFNVTYQKWRMVSSMTIVRRNLGVGVLNNRLYAVGGANGTFMFKSVECYDPSINKWTPVSDMSVCRSGVGVGVLDGVMYAIGGFNGSVDLKSAEIYRPCDGVWSSISDMHFSRYRPGVVALNGLLYVIGGEPEESIHHTVEIYNPHTNTWTLKILSSRGRIYGGVVVDKPPMFLTN
ncbi:kelch-like protein 2 [Acyrthosiphon pisum]|uniref:Kelch-like protein diablo n=1 Tax=Acyrthosiphon pisum TaxID=7029 RepID=A0A8R1W9T8_ACYPI|nr:kelch-like protein 2 [Acyrthosiphon pisum]|eukprot:XP_003247799.1 PREDICTED: kelch-like protein 2 [Acyrthosiphon pisum]